MKKLLAILLLFFSFASAQKTIAVIEFEGLGISQVTAKALTNELESYLSNMGIYRVVERGQMENILQEQGLQQTGCISSECAVEVGQALGAQLLVSGSISKIGTIYSVTAKIMDVETGEVIKPANYRYRGDDVGELLDGMADIVAQLTGQSVKKTPIVTTPTPVPATVSNNLGAISITTMPDGANLWIDDVLVDGLSPYKTDGITEGLHTIRARKGFWVGSKDLYVTPNTINQLYISLVVGRQKLEVISTPSEAEIFIDDDFKGNTPFTVMDLVIGSHNIRLVKGERFLEYTGTVEIKNDAVNSLSIQLQKAPTKDLEVRSSPPGASLFIDGVLYGQTPFTAEDLLIRNYQL
ncbi:MAG: PEGA domain-containing protein, partial [Anaerolineales bacterium]|nr:PEGA domain-containing protein [Anaerolineales bacterium]